MFQGSPNERPYEATTNAKIHSTVLRFDDPWAPLAADVVFRHGGGSERDGASILPAFPNASLRAYRAAVPQAGGFAWFLSSGIGVADGLSLTAELARVRGWIDADNGRSPL